MTDETVNMPDGTILHIHHRLKTRRPFVAPLRWFICAGILATLPFSHAAGLLAVLAARIGPCGLPLRWIGSACLWASWPFIEASIALIQFHDWFYGIVNE